MSTQHSFSCALKVVFYKKMTSVRLPHQLFSKLIQRTESFLKRHGIIKSKTFCIVECTFLTNRAIRMLNNQHRKIDKATDVISLSYLGDRQKTFNGNGLAGEIFISVPYAKKQALQLGHSLRDEMCFLFIHGLLHVFGFDHQNKKEASDMFALTNKILGWHAH